MIDGRVRILNQHLRRYDRDLYADRNAMDGKIEIYRKSQRFIPYSFEGKNLYVATTFPQWVTCLTSDWNIGSPGVDWGIEPLINKIKAMDQWRKEDALEQVRRHNEIAEKNRERAFKNNVRAMAADARKDFAKATNDINTSSLKKISNRRKKDGHR